MLWCERWASGQISTRDLACKDTPSDVKAAAGVVIGVGHESGADLASRFT